MSDMYRMVAGADTVLLYLYLVGSAYGTVCSILCILYTIHSIGMGVRSSGGEGAPNLRCWGMATTITYGV